MLFLGMALCLSGAEKKKKGPKPPDLDILEVAAHRSEEQIAIDGRVRNTGERAIRGLVLYFDFMAPGKAHLTTQNSPLENELLEPGQDAMFRVALKDPPRAVEFLINAMDAEGRDLRVSKPGPFVIE